MYSNLSVGDIVFIHPQASMRFARKWGKVVSIDRNMNGCNVSFHEGGYGFKFFRNEIVILSEYLEILKNCPSGYVRHIPSTTDYKITNILDGGKPFTFKLGNIIAHITELYPVMSCSVCGTDTTDDFSHTCMDCLHPIN